MSESLKPRIQRLRRLLSLRETLSDAAEAGVRESQQLVDRLDANRRSIEENIAATRNETAQLTSVAGQKLSMVERFVQALENRHVSVQYSLDKAKVSLDRRRDEWVEALRQQRIVERTLRRQKAQLERHNDMTTQKIMDESHNGRLARLKTGTS
jgi:flagellar export protein FliJ